MIQIDESFRIKRLNDGTIEVSVQNPRDGLTLKRTRIAPERWAQIVAELRVEVTPCRA